MKIPNSLCRISVVYVIIIKYTLCEVDTTSSVCQPAEEGKRASIVFRKNFHQQNIRVTVERFNYSIARCNFSGQCTDSFPTYYNTTFTINKKTLDVNITVSIFNTSRVDESYWYLVNRKVVLNCSMIVFSRPQLLSCTYGTSNEELSIWCWSSKIYPEANCRIANMFPNMSKLIAGTMFICNNQTLQSFPTYYSPNCSLRIPVENLSPGKYDIELTMYPNVTGDDTDVGFGRNFSLSIELEHPRLVFMKCSDEFEEDTEVTCVCQRSDTSPIKTSLTWVDDTNKKLSVTNVLTFNANTKRQSPNRGFYCVAANTFGLIIAKRFYSPVMINKSLILNCTKSETDGTFTVACRTDRVIPFGLCEINFNKSTQVVTKVSQVDDGNQTPDGDTLYRSSCEFNITRLDLRRGLHEIIVTMYPNVTGNYSDKQFGVYQTMFINILYHASKGVDESRDSTFNPWIYVCVVVGNVLIFVLFLGIWCCKQTENKRPDNYYDEINHEPTEATLADYQRCNGYRTVGGKTQDEITEVESQEEYPEYETLAQGVTRAQMM